MQRKLNVRLLILVAGSFAIFAVGVHFLHGYQLQQNAYRLLELGDRAVEQGEYDRALNYYGQYLVLVPDDPDTVQKYAQALDVSPRSSAERVRLVLLMEKVLRAKPNEHELRLRLIHNLIAVDRIGEAIDNLRKLERHWPDKAQVLHMLGWCQEAKKEYPQAVQSFEQAVALDSKRVETYALLIDVLNERLNLVDEAHKAADDMVEANAKSYQAYLVRARLRQHRGDAKGADHDRDTAYQLAPDRPEVVLAVADAARTRGDWERATKLLQDGLKAHPDQLDFYKLMMDLKLRTGQPGDAIEVARAGLDQLPKSTELAVLLIDLLIDDKHYAEARTKIDELLQAGLKPTLPNYLTARILIADQKWGQACKLLEGVAKEVSSEWSGRVNALLGLCYRNLGDPDREMQAFRRAAAEEPNWLTAHLGLATALLGAGRSDEAVQILESARTPGDMPAAYWILLSRGRLAQELRMPAAERRWDKVQEPLARAEQADPKSGETPLVRAALYAAQSDFAAAKTLLDTARADHPRDLGVWCALADWSMQQGRWEEAAKFLDQAEADVGDSLGLRLARCRLLSQRGDASDREKLARLEDSLPASFTQEQRIRLERELADAWLRLGDRNRAEKVLRDIGKAMPTDLRSRLMLVDLAMESRQGTMARALLDEIRKIEGDAGLHWRLGEIALQIQEGRGQRSKLDDAWRKLQELEKTHKNSPRLALLAATIFDLEGDAQKAIPEYARALELGETRPGTLARLMHLFMERRENAQAETEFLKYERQAPLTKELARLGAEVALSHQDPRYAKLAIHRAQQAIELPMRDYREGLWLARIYQDAGAFDLAERVLQECLDQAGYAPDVWIARMRYLTATDQRSRGPNELARMARDMPKEREPLTRARCLDALHEVDQASQAFREALEASPEDFIVLSHAADFFDRADLSADAQKLYQRLLNDPAAPAEVAVPARRRLAILLATHGNAAAHKQALALLAANSSYADIADERIRLYAQSFAAPTTRSIVLDQFRQTLRRSPLKPDDRILYARMLEDGNLLIPACAQLAEAVSQRPRSPQYIARYIHLLIRTEDLDEAARQMKQLEKLEPDSQRTRNARAALARAGEAK